MLPIVAAASIIGMLVVVVVASGGCRREKEKGDKGIFKICQWEKVSITKVRRETNPGPNSKG
jgi:hypothetical protein